MVILREENVPPLQWKLGRIVELHPGSDGIRYSCRISEDNKWSDQTCGKSSI
jgi:hypothetical protein